MTLARWPLAGHRGLGEQLLRAWSDPGRGYHDVVHLEEVLDRLDELAAADEPFEPVVVRLAAWFHDAVYDGARDDEERSAQWAESALGACGLDASVVAEVARLVRLTATHAPAVDDPDGCALSDADLAILASSPARYASYVAGVRRDYAHLPDTDFARGRAAVLAELLARPALFATRHARARWEAPARANLAAELAALTR